MTRESCEQEDAAAGRVTLRIERGDRFWAAYLSGVPPAPPVSSRDAAGGLFGAVAASVAREGIQPVQEKIFGLVAAREEILSIRGRAFAAAGLDPNLPCAFLQGTPLDRGDLAGVQLFGIIPGDGATRVAAAAAGRAWNGPDYRVLHLPGICGIDANGELGRGFAAQASLLFRNAEAALERENLSFRNVVRTWIYLKSIADRYGRLNAARTAFLAEMGFNEDEGRAFPASTGIQGWTGGEECFMDLMAVEGRGAAVATVVSTSCQGRASAYGSAFSRAAIVRIGGLEIILVSGTASIDAAGATVHRGNPAAQVRRTMRCLAAVLASQGAGLEDIVLATVFCKTADVLRAYREAAWQGLIPELPAVAVAADMCRPDLLVEIEAVAAVPAGRAAPSS